MALNTLEAFPISVLIAEPPWQRKCKIWIRKNKLGDIIMAGKIINYSELNKSLKEKNKTGWQIRVSTTVAKAEEEALGD